MTTFIAIYRGSTVADARLIAVSADPALVGEVAARLLNAEGEHKDEGEDNVVRHITTGRRPALQQVRKEARVDVGLVEAR